MIWVTVIAMLLSLLAWLLKYLGRRAVLSPKEIKSVNNVIYAGNRVRDRACLMGCDPEGEAPT